MSIYIYISSIIADIMSVGGDHSKKVILQVKSGSSPPNSEITEHFMCLYRLTHPHVGGDQRPEEDPLACRHRSLKMSKQLIFQ